MIFILIWLILGFVSGLIAFFIDYTKDGYVEIDVPFIASLILFTIGGPIGFLLMLAHAIDRCGTMKFFTIGKKK